MAKNYDLPKQPGDEFFTQMRERFQASQKADLDRKAAEEDVRFAAGDQWSAKAKKARGKRPTLTENRLGPSISQVCNDGRQNKPAIQTIALDDGNEETAEYYQGRIRHLEYECDAEIAYDTAREHQVTCGRGFLRVTTRYVPGSADQQEALIEAIPNQFSVYWDPSAKKYDLSDADYWFVIDRISKDTHERRFGKNTKASAHGFFEGDDNPAPGWFGVEGSLIQVADYYVREYDEDGNCCVKIYATNGVENLDETEWLGTHTPIVPVWGKQKIVDGEKRNESLIRHSKGPQKLVNLYVSNIAEQISQMPKSPYLAAEGQISGREREWDSINEVQRAVIQYKTRSGSGDPVGPPQRIVNEPPIEALVRGYLQAVDAVKATMGIFDSSLGANKDDTSGVAIAKRQKEADVTNFHFSDNEARSRKQLGRILLEILPLLDGEEPGKKPVREEDGTARMVPINQPYQDKGQMVHHQIGHGDYGIGITTGPSYTSQRQEENERQGQLIQAAPDLMWIIGDQYFASSDGPGSKQMAERMKRAISLRSPGLIEEDENDPRAQVQQITQKAQQLDQQNQQLTQTLHALSQQIEMKQAEQQAKVQIVQIQEQSKMQLAAYDRETRLLLGEIEAKTQSRARQAADAMTIMQAQNERAHQVGMAAMDQAHSLDQGDQARGHAADAADQQAGIQQQQAAQQAGIQQQQAQAQAETEGQQLQPGKVVSIRGRKHVIHKVHPDQSFDAAPIPDEEEEGEGEEAA